MLTPEDRAKAVAVRKTRPTRRQKMAAFAGTFAEQRRRFPPMALPIIDQAEKGSLPAAVKLTCLDCAGWDRRGVRDCVIHWCPLYPHRPYQALRGRKAQGPGAGDSSLVTASPPGCPRRTHPNRPLSRGKSGVRPLPPQAQP